MRFYVALLIVAACAAGGCAVGNTHAYSTILANPTLAGTSAVNVATHDRRDSVQSGEKSPDFVGLQRGGFGNPFNVKTTGGRPLADEFHLDSPSNRVALRDRLGDYRYGFIDKRARKLSINEMKLS